MGSNPAPEGMVNGITRETFDQRAKEVEEAFGVPVDEARFVAAVELGIHPGDVIADPATAASWGGAADDVQPD